ATRRAGQPRSPRSIPDAAPSRTDGGRVELQPWRNCSWQDLEANEAIPAKMKEDATSGSATDCSTCRPSIQAAIEPRIPPWTRAWTHQRAAIAGLMRGGF